MVMPLQAESSGCITVRVFYATGCANTAPAIALIEAVAAELDIGMELSEVVIDTPEQASASSFYGSPTVQVNGRDIEVAVRGSQTFGLT
jgi:hypothetical protein